MKIKKIIIYAFAFICSIIMFSCSGYPNESPGLVYSLNSDGKSYSVEKTTNEDVTNIVIAKKHNGLPVTAIAEGSFIEAFYPEGIDKKYANHIVPGDGITSAIMPDFYYKYW